MHHTQDDLPECAARLIDEHLLYGQVGDDDLAACIIKLSRSRYLNHLRIASLDVQPGFGPPFSTRSLLLLRAMLAGVQEPTADEIASMQLACSVHRLIREYIHDEIPAPEFKKSYRALRHATRDDRLERLLSPLTYAVAFVGAPEADPNRVDRSKLLAQCLCTRPRIESYWHAIYG